MKKLILFTCLLYGLIAGCNSSREPDNYTDAKKAFENFIVYQKNNDTRIVDMFSDKCRIIFSYGVGTNAKSKEISFKDFIEQLKLMISEGEESNESYSNIVFDEEGDDVRVTAKNTNGKSGNTLPFVVVFSRDKNEEMKIIEFNPTVR